MSEEIKEGQSGSGEDREGDEGERYVRAWSE